jgi:hypothetical protein
MHSQITVIPGPLELIGITVFLVVLLALASVLMRIADGPGASANRSPAGATFQRQQLDSFQIQAHPELQHSDDPSGSSTTSV